MWCCISVSYTPLDVYKRQIYACKVQVVCPRCGKPTRVGHKVLQDGTKERICKKCGESL